MKMNAVGNHEDLGDLARLLTWAAQARALAVLWRDAARAASGAERLLATAMAVEGESGWPAEASRFAEEVGFRSESAPTSDDVRALAELVGEPLWIGLALVAARAFDTYLAGADQRRTDAVGAPSAFRRLEAVALAIEGPRAAEWAQALGRRARADGAVDIARLTRALDSAGAWNLPARDSVEAPDEDGRPKRVAT